MTRDERALLLSVAGAMAEILEAGAAPLDTISDHGSEIRTLIDRIQARESGGRLLPHFERRPRLRQAIQQIAKPRAAPVRDPGPP